MNAIHNATGARIRDFPATPDKLLATLETLDGQLDYASITAARIVPRSQRCAGWLSSRRCQIIESDTRGEGNGRGRIISGPIATRAEATRRGTTAIEPKSINRNISECNGTLAATCRAKPYLASASSIALESSPPDVLTICGSVAKCSIESSGSTANG